MKKHTPDIPRVGLALPTLTQLAYEVKDAYTLLGLKRSHFYEEIKEGRIRKMKSGAKTLISAEAMVQWVHDREAESLAETVRPASPAHEKGPAATGPRSKNLSA